MTDDSLSPFERAHEALIQNFCSVPLAIHILEDWYKKAVVQTLSPEQLLENPFHEFAWKYDFMSVAQSLQIMGRALHMVKSTPAAQYDNYWRSAQENLTGELLKKDMMPSSHRLVSLAAYLEVAAKREGQEIGPAMQTIIAAKSVLQEMELRPQISIIKEILQVEKVPKKPPVLPLYANEARAVQPAEMFTENDYKPLIEEAHAAHQKPVYALGEVNISLLPPVAVASAPKRSCPATRLLEIAALDAVAHRLLVALAEKGIHTLQDLEKAVVHPPTRSITPIQKSYASDRVTIFSNGEVQITRGGNIGKPTKVLLIALEIVGMTLEQACPGIQFKPVKKAPLLAEPLPPQMAAGRAEPLSA